MSLTLKLKICMIINLISFGCVSFCLAATYYVNGVMADDSGNGLSWGTAKKYIRSGCELLSGGDTLIIRNGVYTGTTSSPSDRNRIVGVPSGTSGNYTTIKAENDFGVVLSGIWSGGGVTPSAEGPIHLLNNSYVITQGIIVKDCRGNDRYANGAITLSSCDHCKVIKCGVKNGAWNGGDYAGGINLGGSNYCLLEDVFVCGFARYSILVGEGATSHHNIVRRAVVRWDFCTTSQPRAAITTYGGYTGQTPNNEILLQNCIVIDGNDGTTNFTGGFSSPHETSHIHRYGCISLNNAGFGFHSSEDSLSHDNTNEHCVNWDSGGGMWWKNLASGMSGAYNCTTNKAIEGGNNGASYCEAINNVLVSGAAISSMHSTLGNVNKNPSDFTYLVRSPVSGAGATIEKQMGVSGTLYGETGYNTLTDSSLWPFPNEDAISTLFREVNNPSAGLTPALNDVTRGFCADGQTLTRYIWEYLGNTIPSEIYGASLSGDLTGDAQVNIQDLQACVNHILGVQNWGSKADVNEDSSVNILDVQRIANIILGE